MSLIGLFEIYRKGKKILGEKEFGWALDAVETGFIIVIASLALIGCQEGIPQKEMTRVL